MRPWYRGFYARGDNALHSQLLIDLFRDGRKGFMVIYEYLLTLRQVLQLMNFHSNFITEYFCHLWLYRTKRQYRTVIKFFFATSVLVILEACMLCPLQKVHRITYFGPVLFCLLVFYLISFRAYTFRMFIHSSLAISIAHLIVYLPIRCGVSGGNEVLWAAAIVSIMTIVVMLPLRMELAAAIVVLEISLFESLHEVYSRKTYGPKGDQAKLPSLGEWAAFDAGRYTAEVLRLPPRNKTILTVRAWIWMIACFGALYLRFWSNLRRRFAFFKLGKSVQARRESHRARIESVRWVETIMPPAVSTEYQRLRRENEHLDISEWLYMRTLDNVSILFADIVGFTKLSSRLTALQIVLILGDLMKKFDEVCDATHCEKLGTLGDCYYCMAGSEDYRIPHAVCCIEMGLEMCEVLRLFNIERQFSVNIRVGIHTGVAHAAILGCERFRYDVYSYDVRIANELESTGRPGAIHISQSTYEEVQGMYEVTPGPDLLVDKREQSFLLAEGARKVSIPTYFIEPQETTSRFERSADRLMSRVKKNSPPTSVTTNTSMGSMLTFSAFEDSDDSIDSEETDDESESETNSENGQEETEWFEFELAPENLADIKLSHQTNVFNLKRDMKLIHDLRADPVKQHLLFRTPPVDSIFLQFLNPEIEWHYQRQLRSRIGPTFVDSEKLARVIDATVLLVIITVMVLFLVFLGEIAQRLIFAAIFQLIATIIFLIIWSTGTTYPDRIARPWMRHLYDLLTNQFVREFLLAVYTCLPTFITMHIRHGLIPYQPVSHRMFLYAAMNYVSILIHCIPSSAAAWVRTLCCAFTVCILTFSPRQQYFNENNGKYCMSHETYFNGLPVDQWFYVQQYQMLICLVLVIVLCRESERTGKLCFFVHRESQIETEAAEKAMAEARELLFNIVPAYVFEELKEIGKRDLTKSHGTLHYAVAHPLIGVAFISVCNFFTTVYREDLGGVERSLRLLHTILCSFDKLLQHPMAKDVEKIKSMNENYMVAAGLNRRELARNVDRYGHLVALLNYLFMLRSTLNEIRVYQGNEAAQLTAKIGYNCGPVTAGIIGTTKLHYDIWGDTVNVASRMCYTGVPGPIQVPEDVKNLLRGRFRFTYRGEFFVKGKGMMKTYICEPLDLN